MRRRGKGHIILNFIRRITKNLFFQNKLGHKTESVTLGLGPAPAKFVDYTYINGNVHTDWIIKSRQKLTELQILYRNKAVIEAHDSLNENLLLNY